MRINSKLGVQHATFDGKDAGEGLAIFLSQNPNDICRYRFLVKAMIGEGIFQVGTFFSSPPNATSPSGQLSRMVAAAVCPGATGWAVDVSAVPLGSGQTIAPETAEIILASSRCCTSPVGVTRVGERYGYSANASPGATQNIRISPGQTITHIEAIGLTSGGSITINPGGDAFSIPAGVRVDLSPGQFFSNTNTVIAFNNVDWAFEFLESP